MNQANGNNIMNRILLLLFVAIVVSLSAGCSGDASTGYTMISPYRGGIKSIAIPIANRGKNVYRRELEMRLNTHYKVTSQSKADTLLEMTIDQVEQTPLSFNPDTGLPREKQIRMLITFTWKDLRSGEILVHRDRFEVDSTYIPNSTSTGTNLSADSGKNKTYSEDFFQGSEDLIDRAGARIVEQMEADWGKSE
jgi:hypothetical protein